MLRSEKGKTRVEHVRVHSGIALARVGVRHVMPFVAQGERFLGRDKELSAQPEFGREIEARGSRDGNVFLEKKKSDAGGEKRLDPALLSEVEFEA